MNTPEGYNPDWPVGTGEMARRIRAHDWSAGPLGARETWPHGLRAVVDVVVGSGFAMVVLWGPHLIQIYNDAYRDLMGDKHPAGLGQAHRTCWPELWASNAPIYGRVLAGETLSFENASFAITRNGVSERCWFTLSYGPLHDDDGGIAGMLVTVIETTGRVLAPRERTELTALRESDERFRLTADAVPQIVWITDNEGRLEFFNKQWADYIGIPYDPTTAADVATNFVHPDDAGLTMERFDRARQMGEVFEVEHRIRSHDGAYRWFLVRAEPYRDPMTGEIRHWFGASTDIHDRKLAEDGLRHSEERFRSIVETARDYAIFTTDADGRIAIWPEGAQEVFGWTEAEAIGQSVDMTFTPEDRASGRPERERAQARDEGQAPNVRWHIRKDGSRVFIEGVARPLRDHAGALTGFFKIGRNMTERRAIDERLRVLVGELQHRTRNLLGVVRAVSDRTAARSDTLSDFGERFRHRLDALARVNGLLSQLSEGDRITFGTLIRTELAGHGVSDDARGGGQVMLDGPEDIRLRSATVQTLALGLHELATNALKYGALSKPEGRLTVRWGVSPDAEGTQRLTVEWVERGVPPQMETDGKPARQGYGRELIERALPYQLDADVTYVLDAQGVRCTIALPITAAPAVPAYRIA